MTKVQSDVMLVLPNVTMEPSNVRKKKMRTTKCDKRIVICDVKTTKYGDEPIKCEKKIKKPPNVTKVWSNVVLIQSNVTMELSNVRKK